MSHIVKIWDNHPQAHLFHTRADEIHRIETLTQYKREKKDAEAALNRVMARKIKTGRKGAAARVKAVTTKLLAFEMGRNA